jgi:hypothetical protein
MLCFRKTKKVFGGRRRVNSERPLMTDIFNIKPKPPSSTDYAMATAIITHIPDSIVCASQIAYQKKRKKDGFN